MKTLRYGIEIETIGRTRDQVAQAIQHRLQIGLVGGVVLGHQDAQPPLVDDFEVRQTPDLPEPEARVPFRDPVFGTCLVRVTDRAADLSPDDTSAGLKNEYSRVQSFNADGNRILVRGIAAHDVYHAGQIQLLKTLSRSEPALFTNAARPFIRARGMGILRAAGFDAALRALLRASPERRPV